MTAHDSVNQWWEDAGFGPHKRVPNTAERRLRAYSGAWLFIGMIATLAVLAGHPDVYALVVVATVVLAAAWWHTRDRATDQPADPVAADSKSPDHS